MKTSAKKRKKKKTKIRDDEKCGTGKNKIE